MGINILIKRLVSDKTTEASRSTKSRRKSVVTEDDKKKTASHRKLKNVVSTRSDALERFRLIYISILHIYWDFYVVLSV